MSPRRSSRLLACLALVPLLASCGGATTGRPTPSTTSPTTSSSAGDHAPVVAADVYLPPPGAPSGQPVPVVLVVPGGGWYTADRSGLAPLAKDLAAAGFVTVNTTYRATSDGVRFPVPLQDVLCAAGYAVHEAKAHGITPGPVVILGHSAGGHLAALAAVSGSRLAGPCPDPLPAVDGVVGLAGVYDTTAFASQMEELFGVPQADNPALWRLGDPIAYVTDGAAPRSLRVLLLHGDADTEVPLSQSRAFADALTRAGMAVRLDVLPGVTHETLMTPAVSASPVIAWIRDLASSMATASPATSP